MPGCCPVGSARMAWCPERRPDCRRTSSSMQRITRQGDDSAATAQGALGCSTSTYARVRGGGIGSSLSWKFVDQQEAGGKFYCDHFYLICFYLNLFLSNLFLSKSFI